MQFVDSRQDGASPGKRAPINLTRHARHLEGLLKAYTLKKAEVDAAIAGGVIGDQADTIMADLDDADEQLVGELKLWCGADMETAVSAAWQEHAPLYAVDFASILATTEPILARARLLADWAQDDPLDETAAEMLSDMALEWVVLEITLTANGIGRGETSWSGGNKDGDIFAAAYCLRDLTRAVRRDTAWFVYLPICGVELLDLAPGARMGMSHSAFARRLSVALELLRTTQPPAPGKGKPGRRGFPVEALALALQLREKYPDEKAAAILAMCRKQFSRYDLPSNTAAFRTWLSRNRGRTNRTD